MGFPCGLAAKESTCNVGDPGLIPGSGRSTGEGIGYPLQYSWASLVAHLVKNPPAMWETWVWSLDWEDSLDKGKAIHSSILAWRLMDCIIHGMAKSQTRLSDFQFHFQMIYLQNYLKPKLKFRWNLSQIPELYLHNLAWFWIPYPEFFQQSGKLWLGISANSIS